MLTPIELGFGIVIGTWAGCCFVALIIHPRKINTLPKQLESQASRKLDELKSAWLKKETNKETGQLTGFPYKEMYGKSDEEIKAMADERDGQRRNLLGQNK